MSDKAPFYWVDRDEPWNAPADTPGKVYRQAMTIKPEVLVGGTFDFYGAHSNQFKLDDLVFEALEDPDDGYRSHFHSFVLPPKKEIFFPNPIAKIRFEECDEISTVWEKNEYNEHPGDYDRFRGWRLIDIDGKHVWLEIGTKNYNDYYPYFWFYYNPRKEGTEIDL